MRITGLATGLDMDSIIKQTMQPYRIKIQTQQQQKEILEIKQKLYREVVKDSREFYNKYFDISKSDSILLSKNWGTTKFTSSNDAAVSVTGSPGAKGGTYTIEGTKATAAKAEIDTNISAGDKVVVNEKEFTLRGKDEAEIAKNLTADLKEAGITVEARYSKFTSDGSGNSVLVLESKVIGAEGKFTVGGNVEVAVGKQGTNATKGTVIGISLDNIKENKGVIKFGEGDSAVVITLDVTKTDEEIAEELKNKVGAETSLNLDVNIKDGKITFTSKAEGSISNPLVSVGDNAGKFVDGKEATKGGITISKKDISSGINITYGDNINLSLTTDELADETVLNNALAGKELVGSFDKDGNLVIQSANAGAEEDYPIKATRTTDMSAKNYVEGENANIVITDKSNGSTYTHKGNTNSTTIDNMQFTITDIPVGETITVTGKTDVTEIKDKLVGFVNDYNKLMEKLNTLTMEKRNKSFMPLTDEQKAEMSEDEITLWNEKVQKGQLSRDSDVTRLANSMKSAMSNLVSGVDGNLEKFGIKSVSDYQGTLNGTFTIDETKLAGALENNLEDVMKLFIGTPDSGTIDSEKYSNTGIAQKLKTILYDETVTVSSRLIKKAGVENSATSSNNELTKSIEKYEKKMSDMETEFSRREQALYSKWAKIETIMNNLNSQQSYLTSQLGS